jgi:hypothetical protein
MKMEKGIPTPKEKKVLRALLAQKGITRYELYELTNEGTSLPGSRYPLEIESMSGTVVTPSEVYDFWFDWIDGHYTLGEEDGIWRRRNIEELGDKDRIRQIQARLSKEER